MNAPELVGKEKFIEISRLVKVLEKDVKEKNLQPTERIEILQKLRVHCRNPANAEPIFSKEGIEVLSEYAFTDTCSPVSREALRCLANVLLLKADMRGIFVDLGNGNRVAEKLKEDNSDDEFLASRLLFLTTYGSGLDFDKLFDSYFLGESINNHLYRHSKRFSKGQKDSFSQMDGHALSETLKLMFNVANFYPHRVKAFSPSIPHILKILSRINLPSPPLQAPVNYLINSLINLDLEGKGSKQFGTNPVFPNFDQSCNVDRLINILDLAVSLHKPEELGALAVPLITLLRKIYGFAPEAPRKHMERLLLPEDGDRDLPIGQSDTLSSRLLRLSTSAIATTLREGISSLMFELSGSDANNFVRNVGYGFAAGFLMSHDLPVPDSAKETWTTNATNPSQSSVPVNPITGQRLDAEPQDTRPEMTLEEKEREAERLFVLFERLRATGVVNVENPVKKAFDEGRFEDIEDVD